MGAEFLPLSDYADVITDPTFQPVEGEEETYSFSEWLNLNSFHARLLGSGLVRWENFVIWQMRHGLEEELSPGSSTDCRVAVASEWAIQAGPAFLRLCLIERSDFDELQRRSHRAGSLYAGHPGLSLERWGFWKRRLGEVRHMVGEQAGASVDQAIQRMTAAALTCANLCKQT